MKATQKQPWILYIRGKVKKLKFRVMVFDILPIWMLCRFSIVLEFRQYLLKVTSDSESSVLKHKKTTWKSKPIRIIKKFWTRYQKKRAVSTTKASNSPCNSDKNLKVVICISLLALGVFLATNLRGFMTISSVILFLIRMIFKRLKVNGLSNLSAMLLVSTLACSIHITTPNIWTMYADLFAKLWTILPLLGNSIQSFRLRAVISPRTTSLIRKKFLLIGADCNIFLDYLNIQGTTKGCRSVHID